jgi:hypothetical protein
MEDRRNSFNHETNIAKTTLTRKTRFVAVLEAAKREMGIYAISPSNQVRKKTLPFFCI